MKTTAARKSTTRKPDAMTKLISASLRSARADAVKTARMHGTAVIYLKDGKIIREHP